MHRKPPCSFLGGIEVTPHEFATPAATSMAVVNFALRPKVRIPAPCSAQGMFTILAAKTVAAHRNSVSRAGAGSASVHGVLKAPRKTNREGA